ncbi:Pickpocket protein 28, partial [Blattella germanica]
YDFKKKIIDLFCRTGTLNWNEDGDSEHLSILLEMQTAMRLRCRDIFKDMEIRIDSDDNGLDTRYYFRNPTHSYNERYCCTFNGVLPHLMYRDIQSNYLMNRIPDVVGYDWNPDKGYEPNIPKRSIPLRPYKHGSTSGLKLSIHFENMMCFPSNVLKLAIHNPAEVPDFAFQQYTATIGGLNTYRIYPRLTEVGTSVKGLSVEQRNCYFSHEKELTYYRTYTETNCIWDCLAITTLNTCGCLPDYIPDRNGITVCNYSEIPTCFIEYHRQGVEHCPIEQFKCSYDVSNKVLLDADMEACGCLPGCVDLYYEINQNYQPVADAQHQKSL